MRNLTIRLENVTRKLYSTKLLFWKTSMNDCRSQGNEMVNVPFKNCNWLERTEIGPGRNFTEARLADFTCGSGTWTCNLLTRRTHRRWRQNIQLNVTGNWTEMLRRPVTEREESVDCPQSVVGWGGDTPLLSERSYWHRGFWDAILTTPDPVFNVGLR